MEPTTSTTHADLGTARARVIRRTHSALPEQLPRGVFVAELLTRGLPHVAQASFRGAAPPSTVSRLGNAMLVRVGAGSEELEALLRLPGGELALIDAGYGHVGVEVAADSQTAAERGVARLREALSVDPPAPTSVSVAFWMRGDRGGGAVRHREIEAPTLASIADNYSASVGAALERLAAVREPDRGRLILWRGAPGTGKSHALRALAREWAPWCSAHFIMDPDELFGRGGAYVLDVLTWGGDNEGNWRLLILEDAGELIAADSPSVRGQALSRLLNIADGVLGQGTRTLLLITTNEPLKDLHPAARRPGRCLADIEFGPLSMLEANAWLTARGFERRVDRPTAVAELYGSESEDAIVRDRGAETTPAFGFGRVLADTRTV